MIVALDVIDQAIFTLVRGKFSLKKLPTDVNETDETFINQIKVINCVSETSEPKDVEIREEIDKLIENYSPKVPEKSYMIVKVCLTNEMPVYEKPRCLSAKEKVVVNDIIQEWVDKKISQPSNSDFAFSVLIRPKKSTEERRSCIDFRRLNRKVNRNRFPLPIIGEDIDMLQDGAIYSTLDVSFIVPDGQHKSLKTVFGFANSPACFQ